MLADAFLALLFVLTIAACPKGRHFSATESALIFSIMSLCATVTVDTVTPWLHYAIQWAMAATWFFRMMMRGSTAPATGVAALATLQVIMAVDRLLYAHQETAILAAYSYIAVTIYVMIIAALVWDGRHGNTWMPRRRWNDYGNSKANRVER